MKIKQGKRMMVLLNFMLLLGVQESEAWEEKYIDTNPLEVYYEYTKKSYGAGLSAEDIGKKVQDEELTLAEAYKISLETLGEEFKISEGEMWHVDVENKAKSLNIYNGAREINEKITRRDMVDIMFNMMKGKEEESKIKFEDEIDGKIGFLVNKGMISGYTQDGKTYFRGESIVSKAEFLTLTFLFLGVVKKQEEKDNISVKVNKNDEVEEGEKNKKFKDLTLNKEDFNFNTRINDMKDIVENLLYSAVNDKSSYRVDYDNIKNKDDYHLMFFEAAQILNDKYPEYFSYYSRLNAEVIENSQDSEYIVKLLPAEGKRKDGLDIIKRRDMAFDYLDDAFNNLAKDEKITPYKSDEENAKEIYKWVLDNISYKDDEGSHLLPADYDTFDVYGATSRKEGVCQAYVGAFNYMLRKAGIEASGVAGKINKSGESHVWTMTIIDGREVYIDPTLGYNNNMEKYFDITSDVYSSTYREKNYNNFS